MIGASPPRPLRGSGTPPRWDLLGRIKAAPAHRGRSLLPPLVVLLILSLLGAGAHAAGLLADPDRTRLGANETLTLRLVAEGQPNDEPDLSPLEQDFEILSRSNSTRTTIINGDLSQSREWVLELVPRRAGELLIPPLALGAERSQPVPIQVVPADQVSTAGEPRPLFIDTRTDTSAPYVQEPFTYRVRVYYRELPLRATLSDPQVDGATIERRGDDQSSTEMVDGQRYSVIERRYLVVPQRSGPITIGSPQFAAVLIDSRPRGQRSPSADLDQMLGGRIFQGATAMPNLGSSRRVVERGPDRTLEVRPQPDGAATPWLPAQSVQLTDQWTPSPPRLRVGEPVTRTLTLTAQGATAVQLPTLDGGSPDGVRVYPEPPILEDLAGTGPPVAIQTLKMSVVPTRSGPLTWPETRLHWWDTVEDRQRVAVIPERILQVEPAVGAETAGEPVPASAELPSLAGDPRAPISSPPSRAVDLQQDPAPMPPMSPLNSGTEPGLWRWLSLALGLGWLLTLGWMLWQRRRQGSDSAGRDRRTRPAARPGSTKSALASLRRACVEGSPRAARDAVLTWGRACWPERPPAGLGALAERLGGAQAAQVLGALDRVIYAPWDGQDGSRWDGMAAWTRIEPLLRGQQSAPSSVGAPPLPSLYPGG